MVRLYFVCMGNYYRSRLAEELARHYAAEYGLEIEADSGGLSKVLNSSKNPGPIAEGTLLYLAMKNVQPQAADRYPKKCDYESVAAADIVVCTDEDEQRGLFFEAFPEFNGTLICWNARDIEYDPWLRTTELIDFKVQELIKDLSRHK